MNSDFARIMVPVAVEVLGTPNDALSDDEMLRWGSRGAFKVDRAKGVWVDHSDGDRGGGVLDFLRIKKNLDKPDALEWLRERKFLPADGTAPKGGTRKPQIVATYDYQDEAGALLFQVVRFDPKDFRQRQPDGKGDWIWKMAGVRKVIYRLPQVLAAVQAGQRVFIAEGEKAVHALEAEGLVATCSPGGAGKWKPEFSTMLAGADVVVLPDNDEPGEAHAAQVMQSLTGTAQRVQCLRLPHLPPKGDVADWFAAGGTAAELVEHIQSHDAAIVAGVLRSPPADAWPRPSRLAADDAAAPPALDIIGIFPSGWARWIEVAAEMKGAPQDYVALALLAGAGALIGNARWSSPWNGWAEPPGINAALIGNPSAGKSPALDAVQELLAAIEAESNADIAERRRQHETDKAAAAERKSAWAKDVKTAVGSGRPPPTMPADAEEPEAPHRRRLFSTEPTIEKAARLSAANPRGMLLLRDELAGWLASMDRYSNSSGGDRAFWLQAYGGRPWVPDRVKDGDSEVSVPHLTWVIAGTIQPDRLASLLLAGDDDGMAARFVYVWPPSRKPTRPRAGLHVPPAAAWLRRLRALPWTPPEPVMLPFSTDAQAALQAWREEVAALEDGVSGLFLSWLGKLPGFAVRAALIFAHLAWCEAAAGDPPAEVTAADMDRALTFLEAYAVPMARRCFGEAALPVAERDARKLARWLQRRPDVPDRLNVQELRRMAGGPGISTAERLGAALAELEGLGWVRPAESSRPGQGGRSRNDWLVNPALMDATDGLA